MSDDDVMITKVNLQHGDIIEVPMYDNHRLSFGGLRPGNEPPENESQATAIDAVNAAVRAARATGVRMPGEPYAGVPLPVYGANWPHPDFGKLHPELRERRLSVLKNKKARWTGKEIALQVRASEDVVKQDVRWLKRRGLLP